MSQKNVWRERPYYQPQIICPVEFDLSAPTVDVPVYSVSNLPSAWGNKQENVVAVVKEIRVLYTEGTSPDDGVLIRVGNDVNASFFHDYFTEINKSSGTTTIIKNTDFTAEDRVFNTHEWINIRCGGNKVGSGKVKVVIVISFDYTDSKSY